MRDEFGDAPRSWTGAGAFVIDGQSVDRRDEKSRAGFETINQ